MMNEIRKALDLFRRYNEFEPQRTVTVYKGWNDSIGSVHWLAGVSLSSVKEGALFNGINLPIAAVATYALGFKFFDAVGLILLLEATGLMIAGGAMEMGATASTRRLVSIFQGKKLEWSRRDYSAAQMRGAVFTLTGVLLFAESLLMAALVLR